MTAEGNDWFVYRFEGISAASIVFNDGAGRQTADLKRENDGNELVVEETLGCDFLSC